MDGSQRPGDLCPQAHRLGGEPGRIAAEEVKESIRVGTKIEKLRSWRGVAFYVAKYISKGVQGGWENVGRYWGIVGRAQMPWSPVGEEFLDYRTAILIRRTARRYLTRRSRNQVRFAILKDE
jgi:hypothetical protein